MAKKQKKKRYLPKRKKEDKKRLLQIIFTVIIAVSLISSIAGFLYNSNRSTSKLKGYHIEISNDGYYVLSKRDVNIKVYTNPTLLLSENASKKLGQLSFLADKQFIIYSFDPYMNTNYLAFLDPARFMFRNNVAQNNVQVIEAITRNSTNYLLPVLNCDNASEQVGVIVFRQAMDENLSAIYPRMISTNNCVIVLLDNPYEGVLVTDYLSILLTQNGEE